MDQMKGRVLYPLDITKMWQAYDEGCKDNDISEKDEATTPKKKKMTTTICLKNEGKENWLFEFPKRAKNWFFWYLF